MDLSRNILKEFAEITNDSNQPVSDNTVYGTIVEYNGSLYAQLDGSNALTPITSTTSVKVGERVIVTLKNHLATVTGNLSDPSASGAKVEQMDTLIAEKANIVDLNAQTARIDTLTADNVTINAKLTAYNASIEKLEADRVIVDGKLEANAADIETLQTGYVNVTERLDAGEADIDTLQADNVTIKEKLTANEADVDKLEADNVVIKEELNANSAVIEKLDATYVNIDFTNIDQAWMEEFYAKSGLIEYITAEGATVTGQLIGVTIKGDYIEGGTIKADKLVIKDDETGLYYKLNFEAGTFADAEEVPTDSLHGSVITANTITAEKISVSDLVAFDATIGGFNISEKGIYSGVKESVDNSTKGIYLDTDGQVSIGDADNYIKYYKTVDEGGNEVYKLEIFADSIFFGDGSKSSAADLKALTEHVKIGTCIDEETGDEKPCVELAEGDTDFKLRLTNKDATFLDGDNPKTKVDIDGLTTENISVEKEYRHGEFVWVFRENKNLGLIWKEVTE